MANKRLNQIKNHLHTESLVQLSWIDKIAVVTLNRTEKKNAMNPQLVYELKNCLVSIEGKARVLILKSSSKESFCVGADLTEILEMDLKEQEAFIDESRDLVNILASFKVPTICCIEGYALGAGLEIALACDIRIAAPNSKLGLPEAKIGLFPGAGGSVRLPLIVGPALAKEIMFTCCTLDAKRAFEIRLVNAVEMNCFESCLKMAKKIATLAPLSVMACKASVENAMQVSLDQAFRLEKAFYNELLPSKDFKEGLESFKSKQPPKFQGK